MVVSRAGSRTDAAGEYDDPSVVERMRLAVAELEDALDHAAARSAWNPADPR
ncbi:hypothetical protein [Nocardiopsis codii]|uniref:hypothetical protein n=1 Tax=Nocardiopsis codii TaxID=3065942 RepID=UPI002E7C432F|nr:hypothetical protein [Nocardiopsis sp. CT-R113]